jgi:prevent-host-death family protein
MKFITVTELKKRATQIITQITANREEVVVTKNGKPVVLIQHITEEIFKLKERDKRKEQR